MTNRIKLLIGINITLLAGVLFSLQSSRSNSTIQLSQQGFTLEDTLGIKKIVLGNNSLEKTGPNDWEVNSNFKVQPSRIQSLFAVLGRLQVKRPVPEASLDSVNSLLNSTGFSVSVYNEEEQILKNFELAGKGDETYARLEGEQTPYIVYIPGYFVNIYELFNINEQEWRDKRVLYTTWRTLQNLQIDYINDEKNDVNISFDSSFYKVAGVQKLDSAKLYSYIQQYQNFEVDAFVQNAENLKQTLSKTQPFCVVLLNDLYESRNNSLMVYPNDSTVYGIVEKSSEVVRMNRNMLRNYLVSKQEFEKPTN